MIVERLREKRSDHIAPEDMTVLQENIAAYESGETAFTIRRLSGGAMSDHITRDEIGLLQKKADAVCAQIALWNATLSKYDK